MPNKITRNLPKISYFFRVRKVKFNESVITAAGLVRLRPLTNTSRNNLVKIQGKPLLQMWIDKLLNLKINEIIINTHYFAEKVESLLQKIIKIKTSNYLMKINYWVLAHYFITLMKFMTI